MIIGLHVAPTTSTSFNRILEQIDQRAEIRSAEAIGLGVDDGRVECHCGTSTQSTGTTESVDKTLRKFLLVESIICLSVANDEAKSSSARRWQRVSIEAEAGGVTMENEARFSPVDGHRGSPSLPRPRSDSFVSGGEAGSRHTYSESEVSKHTPIEFP